AKMELYEYNRRLTTCLYSDYMIYSPAVPVFRADNGALLERPYLVSFLTAPAVNANAVKRNEPSRVGHIRATMKQRLERLLWVAHEHGHRSLILGAWGCGVFGNEPAMVAELFEETLGGWRPIGGRFREDHLRRLRPAEGSTGFGGIPPRASEVKISGW